MSFFEALKLALDAILAHKLRSFLTLLGVIFGVATVIVVVSLIEGFNRYVDEKIADIGTNAFSVQKYALEDYSSVENLEKARRRNKDVTLDDLEALRRHGGSIADAGAKVSSIADVKFGDESLFGVTFNAATANMETIDRTEIDTGRYFSQAEEQNKRPVCIIGADVADRLFPTTQPLGKIIKVDGRPFEVIGVAAALGSVFGQPRDKFVTVPLQTFLTYYGSRRSIFISVVATAEIAYQDAIDETRTVMRARRKLNFQDEDNFGIVTPSAINELRDKIFGTIQIVAVGVTAISLVVGAIVIMNIMFVSVSERTKEIGIRKSLGARRRDVLKQFLLESFVLALTGGIIGVTIAFVLSRLVSTLTPIPTALPLLWVIVALAVSGSVGLLSGVYPAWKAARLDPIEALRAD